MCVVEEVVGVLLHGGGVCSGGGGWCIVGGGACSGGGGVCIIVGRILALIYCYLCSESGGVQVYRHLEYMYIY